MKILVFIMAIGAVVRSTMAEDDCVPDDQSTSCVENLECCENLTCDDSLCIPNLGCSGAGTPCLSSGECCSHICDAVCVDCICHGCGVCSKDSNCCDSLVCDDGVCVDCSSSKGVLCSETNDCCPSSTGHICYAGFCSDCGENGVPCVTSGDCCGSTDCKDGFCGGIPDDCGSAAVWCCLPPVSTHHHGITRSVVHVH